MILLGVHVRGCLSVASIFTGTKQSLDKLNLSAYRFKMTSHLSWMIVRNNSAFLLKKRNISKPFSTVRFHSTLGVICTLFPMPSLHLLYCMFQEPNNLLNLNSYRYNGIVHKKSIGIVPAADKKGFTVVYKKAKASVSFVRLQLCFHTAL